MLGERDHSCEQSNQLVNSSGSNPTLTRYRLTNCCAHSVRRGVFSKSGVLHAEAKPQLVLFLARLAM